MDRTVRPLPQNGLRRINQQEVEPHRPTARGKISCQRQKWQAMQRKVNFIRFRYTTHIDPEHPKEDWDYEQEQIMFNLHNELGNKWAVIGLKLGGK